MPQSEIARERRNIRKIIARGAKRGVKFDIPIDLNTATLDELKAYHRDIYNYASAHDQMFGELHGQDVKKYENRKRTAHARGKETISIDYEIDMEENPAETYDENRDKFDFNTQPDYDDIDTLPGEDRSQYNNYVDADDIDYSMYDTSYDDSAYEWSDDTIADETLYDSVIQQLYDLAGEYSDDAISSLMTEIDVAIANLGKEQVVKNVIRNSEKFVDTATKIAKYAGMPGRGAQETRLRNYQTFINILYGNDEEVGGAGKAEAMANAGTNLSTKLKNMEPPKKALKFETLEAGLALDYKRFWYKDSSGSWAYYDSRKKQ